MPGFHGRHFPRPSYGYGRGGYPRMSLIDVAPVLAPAVGEVRVTDFALSGNTLTATIDVDGQQYTGSLDLSDLMGAVGARVAAYHQQLHELAAKPSSDLSADAARAVATTSAAQNDAQAALTVAGVALVGSLVDKHQAAHDALCAGWWDSVTNAVSSAAKGVYHAGEAGYHGITHTWKALKVPIQVAATAFGGPAAGALAGTVIDAANGDIGAQQAIAQVKANAQVNPDVAKALTKATTAAAKATAAYHVADTVTQAAGGNPDAGAAVQELVMAAAAGDPGAASALALAQSAIANAAQGAQASQPAAVVASGIATNLRHEASHAAGQAQGPVIGYVRPHGNPPQMRSFASVNDADDWYGQWLGLPYAFSYVAYFDKNDPSWPSPLNEQFGKSPPWDTQVSGWILPLLTGAGGFAAGYFEPEIAKLGRNLWNRARGAAHVAAAPVAPPPPQA